MTLLAVYYQNGLAGLNKDLEQCAVWAQRGAAKGNATCVIVLAGLYAEGMCLCAVVLALILGS